MFNVNRFEEFLKNFSQYDSDKAVRKLNRDYLTNPDFGAALFAPNGDSTTEKMEAIYKLTSKKKVVRLFNDAIQEGEYDYPRWTAVYANSIARSNHDSLSAAMDAVNNADMSNKERDIQTDKIMAAAKESERLQKAAFKIVKHESKTLAAKANVDKALAKKILALVPNNEFIGKNRIPFYTNLVLNQIYRFSSKEGIPTDNINFYKLFSYLFGKQNVAEVATFILLEGIERLGKFKCDTVMKTWDSLTAFALDELERADIGMQGQLIEIYLKRLATMMANGERTVRVDLREISQAKFPRLSKTVASYKDKFDSIIDGER